MDSGHHEFSVQAFPPETALQKQSDSADRPSIPLWEESYVAPTNDVERCIAWIWQELLEVERVGIHDTFYDLGGDSLFITQLNSRLRDIFQIELSLQNLLETLTVAEQARMLLKDPDEQMNVQKAAELLVRSGQLSDEEKGIRPTSAQTIPRRKDASSLPLSFGQERLWFLAQYDPGNPVYNNSFALQLRGPLKVEALHQSLQSIVQRHEAWRTSFVTVEDSPIQIIAPALSIQLQVVDLEGLPAGKVDEVIAFLGTQEARQPFDLSRGPLLRTSLLRLEAEDHMLLLTVHHIVSDAWSLGIFIYELATLYQSFIQGRPSPLPELPVQYADYAIWQRQWVQNEVLDTQLRYWRQHLAGIPALLLPTDRPRPPVQIFAGAHYHFTLPQLLSERLKALSQQEDVTLFMTLLAAFLVLLWRYTGQDDLPVGTSIAGRTHTEVEELLGFFVNTLVLRTNLSGDPPFNQLLRRVREVALEAYAHQDLPFEKLVEKLAPDRDPSRNPLFQVMFVLYNVRIPDMALPDLTIHLLGDTDTRTAKLDLTLVMWEVSSCFCGFLEYNTDLFDESTIARMAGHLETLLDGIVTDPQRPISRLPLMQAVEHRQVIADWNATATLYPQSQCIHHLFEAQVKRTPEAMALVYDEMGLTYCELDRRANQLAHYLKKLGVGPEVRVGLYVERSLEMVIGLLGILKAGGAYVPLDPNYPQKRLAFMLEDAQVAVLLTMRHQQAQVAGVMIPLVLLDVDWPRIALESGTPPRSTVRPANLAYIIYTSGSTGKPKGVMVEHTGLGNLAQEQGRVFGVGPHSQVLQFASLSFDASVFELTMALVSGATLNLAPREALLPGPDFVRLLREQAISIVTLPPSVLATLSVEDLPTVETLIVAGEACPADLVTRWHRRLRFFNAYGPTEATVWATNAECQNDEHFPPIGRPIANTQVYLLDTHLQPVPVGVPAELYLGGIGLARGYFGQPELTAERFVPHPFSSVPGARLYRTGDIARYRSDGQIEFLGRVDSQVKLRGIRIELAEIEITLLQHPAIQEVVVTVGGNTPNDRQLITYLVPRTGVALSPRDLRSFLQERLPAYMQPSAFILLEALPLNPNGKIDHRALPAPDRIQTASERVFAQPGTISEELVAGIWSEILETEQIGIYDNFFELGGHSLLFPQMLSRLRHVFRQDISVVELFKYPTVSSLAKRLSQGEQFEQLLSQDSVDRSVEIKKGKARRSQQLKRKQQRAEN